MPISKNIKYTAYTKPDMAANIICVGPKLYDSALCSYNVRALVMAINYNYLRCWAPFWYIQLDSLSIAYSSGWEEKNNMFSLITVHLLFQ